MFAFQAGAHRLSANNTELHAFLLNAPVMKKAHGETSWPRTNVKRVQRQLHGKACYFVSRRVTNWTDKDTEYEKKHEAAMVCFNN